MTTSITVDAHCDPDTKEVKVTYDTGDGPQEKILQDGESTVLYVHEPEHSVTVAEVDKVQASTLSGPGGCEKCPPE